MSSTLSIAQRLAIAFPSSHIDPDEIAECGRKVLEENSKKYQDIANSQGGSVFTIDAVNAHNKKVYRLRTLAHNRQVLQESSQTAKEIKQQIDDLRSRDDVREILDLLKRTPDVSEIVLEKLEKLMESPGLATQLNTFINNAAGDEYERTEQELLDARQQLADWRIELREERMKTRAAEEDLRRCNRIITQYAFGSMTTLGLDYEAAERTLRMTPRITEVDVDRALQHLNPYVFGLPNHAPLTGFQIWVEATVRPESFTTSMIIAYLKNLEAGAFRDIGFLLLAVDALVQGSQDSLTGFAALAVFDILHLWTYLDSTQAIDIRQRFQSAVAIRPRVILHNERSSLFEKFLLGVQECLEYTIDPEPQAITKRGERFLRDINLWLEMSHKAINMTSHASRRSATLQSYNDVKLVSLGSDPPYFLYVGKNHISWLQPKDVITRVDPLNDVLIIHDQLDPHVIAERRISLQTNDLPRIITVLRGTVAIQC